MDDTGSVRPRIDAVVPPNASEASPPRGLRARLREETRAAHERLDASFAGLADGDRRDYALFLRVNAACLAAIEPVLDESPLAAAMPDLAAPPRAGAAAADLAAMSLRPIASPAFPFPRPSLAQSVGIAYVVEGSRLGARMILKRLRKDDGAETSGPLTTFFLESAEGPERFREFLGRAETLLATAQERDAAVKAADATFAYFLDSVRLARAANHDGGAN